MLLCLDSAHILMRNKPLLGGAQQFEFWTTLLSYLTSSADAVCRSHKAGSMNDGQSNNEAVDKQPPWELPVHPQQS